MILSDKPYWPYAMAQGPLTTYDDARHLGNIGLLLLYACEKGGLVVNGSVSQLLAMLSDTLHVIAFNLGVVFSCTWIHLPTTIKTPLRK